MFPRRGSRSARPSVRRRLGVAPPRPSCESTVPASDPYLDAFGLYFRSLGHQDLQHAVLGRGLDRVRHDMVGQVDRAKEGAVAALDPMDPSSEDWCASCRSPWIVITPSWNVISRSSIPTPGSSTATR